MGSDRTPVAQIGEGTFLRQQESACYTFGGETRQVELIFWQHGVKHCDRRKITRITVGGRLLWEQNIRETSSR